MYTRPARNVVTFKWYNPACSFHFKIQSHHEDNMSIALLTVCDPVHFFLQCESCSLLYQQPVPSCINSLLPPVSAACSLLYQQPVPSCINSLFPPASTAFPSCINSLFPPVSAAYSLLHQQHVPSCTSSLLVWPSDSSFTI